MKNRGNIAGRLDLRQVGVDCKSALNISISHFVNLADPNHVSGLVGDPELHTANRAGREVFRRSARLFCLHAMLASGKIQPFKRRAAW